VIRTFRIGDKPKRREGLRVGTTRYPPRGVSKSGRKKFFDVWFPVVAPSAKLLRSKRGTKAFFDAYRRELERPPASHGVALLAALAAVTPVSVGCYCADETVCHRGILCTAIKEAME
jgi:uncharacterized protein YeaO (DUF488 family)